MGTCTVTVLKLTTYGTEITRAEASTPELYTFTGDLPEMNVEFYIPAVYEQRAAMLHLLDSLKHRIDVGDIAWEEPQKEEPAGNVLPWRKKECPF